MSLMRVYLVDREVQPPRFEHEVSVEVVDGRCPQLLRYAGSYWVLWSLALGYCKVEPVEIRCGKVVDEREILGDSPTCSEDGVACGERVEVKDVDVGELDFSSIHRIRILKVLRSNGIFTVGILLRQREHDLLRLPRFARHLLKPVVAALAKSGLSLLRDEPGPQIDPRDVEPFD
jgi:hypothetical protein